MTQHGAFQVKAVTFQIAEHFFDPHSAGIGLQSYLPVRKVGSQAPRFVFPNLLMYQQVHRINLGLRQPSFSQPHTPARLFNPTPKIMPLCLPKKTNVRAIFLAHNVIPVPSFQLLQHFYRPKFAVTDQQDGDSLWKKASNVGQQSQLSLWCAMSSNLPDPCPGDWNSTFPVSQTDYQQLMGKADFGSIHNQTNLLKVFGLHFQPAACNWLVPITNIDHWVSQKSAQTLYHAEQLRFTWDLARNPAQTYRTALMNAHDQPGEILDACFSFARVQLSNSHVPSMIEIVDWHDWLLFLMWQKQVYIYRADQSLFLKMYGG